MPSTRVQRANRAFAAAISAAKTSGLEDFAAIAHGIGTWWAVHQGGSTPAILSGYRSPERQRTLRVRWDRGDRAGLAARPACQSWHTVGRAWDVSTSHPRFDLYRSVVSALPGIRWGGTFGDPGHFDLPGDDFPPNIC